MLPGESFNKRFGCSFLMMVSECGLCAVWCLFCFRMGFFFFFLVGGVGKFVRISWPNSHSYFLTCLVCSKKVRILFVAYEILYIPIRSSLFIVLFK